MKKYTWQILANVWTADLIKRISHRLKLHPDTVGAWKRPPESDEFPTGTGKTNLLDHVLFLIREIHKSFPGTAREIAEYILAYVNWLDRREGVKCADESDSPCAALAETVREHADVVVVLSAHPHDRGAWKQARKEIREEISALIKLDGCLETLLEKEFLKAKSSTGSHRVSSSNQSIKE